MTKLSGRPFSEGMPSALATEPLSEAQAHEPSMEPGGKAGPESPSPRVKHALVLALLPALRRAHLSAFPAPSGSHCVHHHIKQLSTSIVEAGVKAEGKGLSLHSMRQ